MQSLQTSTQWDGVKGPCGVLSPFFFLWKLFFDRRTLCELLKLNTRSWREASCPHCALVWFLPHCRSKWWTLPLGSSGFTCFCYLLDHFYFCVSLFFFFKCFSLPYTFFFPDTENRLPTSDSNGCFYWVKGGCVPWSIDCLVFVTSTDCRRWVHPLILPLRLKVWKHSLLSLGGKKIKSVMVSPFWIWLSDIRRISERHIAVVFVTLQPCTELKWPDPGFWPTGVRHRVLNRNAVGHVSFSQTSRPFVIALGLLKGFP